MEAATEQGIIVANSGDANSGSVAEHAVALMLAVLHDVPNVDRKYRQGGYNKPGRSPSEIFPVRWSDSSASATSPAVSPTCAPKASGPPCSPSIRSSQIPKWRR
ncbi:hypothetical protein [Blastococcus brunescens]|uniref:hypothetical protein n=1 Tax=Blastococcus brunescens TaxID=1564165 RepID=UPI003BEEF218